MKDKLNRFMQGRYGVDNFARFTLGVALFVIVVGSFMRQNAAGGVSGYSWIYSYHYTYFRILSRKYLCTICGKPEISGIYSENPQPVYQRKKYDGAEKKHIISIPARVVDRKFVFPEEKDRKVEIECPKCHEKFYQKDVDLLQTRSGRSS